MPRAGALARTSIPDAAPRGFDGLPTSPERARFDKGNGRPALRFEGYGSPRETRREGKSAPVELMIGAVQRNSDACHSTFGWELYAGASKNVGE